MTSPEDDIEMLQAIQTSVAALKPFIEAAEGIKTDLERRGWSPTIAESVAHQWLLNVVNRIWNPK